MLLDLLKEAIRAERTTATMIIGRLNLGLLKETKRSEQKRGSSHEVRKALIYN